MSVIDRVKNHFESQGVKLINVAEWGEEGQPLVIYSTPMSLAEKRNLFKSAKDNDLGVMVDVIALKAKDKDGNKMFKLDDKQVLMNKADPEVIARVAGEILNSVPFEDIEKK
tara:strand:- start:148 stop:483 length:336 start_codon:yes stop_codon:yes gene_type:complete